MSTVTLIPRPKDGDDDHQIDARAVNSKAARSLYKKARELCDRKIVGSEEECDLAFVFGIGFAMYLGGPIFHAQQRGWA